MQSERSGTDCGHPRYEGVTPRSGDSDMPAFVSQYLAGEDDVDGIQRCASHSNNPRTPSYDGRQASDDDTASYAPSWHGWHDLDPSLVVEAQDRLWSPCSSSK